MPRVGLVGDTAIADRNGQQLGYAALSALTSMQPPATDFAYLGPVVSGATLGAWAPSPQSGARQESIGIFAGATHTLDLPMIPKPERHALKEEIAKWQDQGEAADEQGDVVAARDANAYIERAVRWLARLDSLPEGSTYPFSYSVYRMGDAVWITCSGEPATRLRLAASRAAARAAASFCCRLSVLAPARDAASVAAGDLNGDFFDDLVFGRITTAPDDSTR